MSTPVATPAHAPAERARRLHLGSALPHWVDDHRVRVFALLAYLYAAGFSLHLRLSPDTAGYLIAGRRLADGGPLQGPAVYADNLVPGYPLLVSAFFRLFGDAAVPALLVFSLTAGLAAVALTYALIRDAAGHRTALVVAFILGVNETVYSYALRPMPDLLFMIGVLLTLIGWQHCTRAAGPDDNTNAPSSTRDAHHGRLPGLLALAAGVLLMAAMRSVAAVVVAALALDAARLLVRAGRWRALALLALAVPVVLALVHVLQAGPTLALTPDEQLLKQRLIDDLPHTLRHALTDAGPALITGALPEAVVGFGFTDALALPLGVLILIAAARLGRARPAWFILLLLFTLQWLIVDATPRYLLPVLPILCYAWWKLAVDIERKLGPPHGRTILILLLVLVPGGSIVKSIHTMMQQRSQPYYAHYNGGKYESVLELAGWIERELPADALVIAGEHDAAELAYLTGRDVRPAIGDGYEHPGPCYAIAPLDTNTEGHRVMGYIALDPPVFAVTNHKGQERAVRRVRRTGTTPDGPRGVTDPPRPPTPNHPRR